MKKIAIIGGGFAGVSLAWSLCHQRNSQQKQAAHAQETTSVDFEIELYEKTDRLGGLLQTHKTELGIVEPAANAILRTRLADEMLEDFGVSWAIKKKTAKNRWVMTQKGPKKWPLSLWESLRNLDRLFAVAQGKAKHKPKAGETVSQWAKRVFRSPGVTNKLIAPALQGIYAHTPEKLSASLCLNSMFNAPQADSKTMGSAAPQEGLGEVFKAAQAYLKQEGVRLKLNHEIKEPPQADWVIDCRPNALGLTMNYQPIFSVSLFWEIAHRPRISGFGCLFPQSEKYLGVLFDSDIFQNRTFDESTFLEKWIIVPQKNQTSWSSEDLKSLLEFRQKHLGQSVSASAHPKSEHGFFWPAGIPSYDIHLEKQLNLQSKISYKNEQIFHDAQNPKWLFHGNYLGDLGLNKILQKSSLISQYLMEQI